MPKAPQKAPELPDVLPAQVPGPKPPGTARLDQSSAGADRGAGSLERHHCRAGCAPGGHERQLHWHFSSRDEIVEAALDHWETERIDVIEGLREISDPTERLERLVTQIYKNRDRGALFAALQASSTDPRVEVGCDGPRSGG